MPKTLQTHRDDDAPRDAQDAFDHALVMKHVAQLLEHFTSVRIFITRHDSQNDNTKAFSRGGGDFYSQWGGIDEWHTEQKEATRRQVWRDDDE